jgi:hypothetical protein
VIPRRYSCERYQTPPDNYNFFHKTVFCKKPASDLLSLGVLFGALSSSFSRLLSNPLLLLNYFYLRRQCLLFLFLTFHNHY